MKKLLLVITMVTTAFTLRAQEFYQSVGLSYMILTYNQEYKIVGFDEVYSNSGYLGAPTITYNPMLAFDLNGGPQLVAAAYPSLGFSFSSSGGDNYLALQLPLAAELFFGDLEDLGGFVGLGLNFGLAGTDYASGTTGGPELSAGGQFYAFDNLIKLRGAYTIGAIKSQDDDGIEFVTDKRSLINLSILYYLGM